jgi:hypothetical protein
VYVDLRQIKQESRFPKYGDELEKEQDFHFEESVQEGSFEREGELGAKE